MKQFVCRLFVVNMKSDIFHLALLTLVLIEVVSVKGETLVLVNAESLEDINITQSGTYRRIINDAEAEQWGIWPDAKCKKIIQAYSKNKETTPNYCYLHEPTKWKLYSNYGKPEVTTVYEIKNISKVRVDKKEIILAKKRHENNSNNRFTIKYSLQKTVTDTVSHSSSSTSNFTLGGLAQFQIFGTAIGFQSQYQHSWGQSEQKSNSKTIGVATETTVDVSPNSTSTITFKTTLVSMSFDITFYYRLEGYIATYYKPIFGDPDFEHFDIKHLKSINNEKTFTETVTVNFHQEGNIVVDEQPMKSDHYQDPSADDHYEALSRQN